MAETPQRAGGPRQLVSIVALILLAALAVWQLFRLRDPAVFAPDDFVEYWAAGAVNLEGGNPYDGKLLEPKELLAGRTTDLPVMMWNPPWTLTFVMPYGAVDPFDAKVIWLLQNWFLCVFCADWLWRIYGGPRRFRWLAWLLALTYMPTILVLGAGQIGPLILFGITLFLALERAGLPWLAGAAGVLMAIKPHLVYLFWPALAGWSWFRGWKIVGGGLAAGAIATLIPMAFNTHVLPQYWQELTQRPPAQWKSPTLGTLIRMAEARIRGTSEFEAFSLQFVPNLLGALWLLWFAWSVRKLPWVWRERLPIMLLISFVTASYGAWPYDLVILMPAVIQVAVRTAERGERRLAVLGVAAWVLLNLPALLLNVFGAYSFWYLWMGPLLLFLYWWLMRELARPPGDSV